MQKFIAAFDGLSYCETTLNYAIYFARQCNAHLVGVFLEDVTRHSYGMADITRHEGASFDQHVQALNQKDQEEREESVGRFEQACRTAGLSHSIHRDRNVALQDLMHESIYSDLLIISYRETLTRHKEPQPTRFIRELLTDIQCPVVLVPAKYKPITRVCFLYDGGPSSVHAVRMFGYLFNPFKNLHTEVITVKGPVESFHLPDNRLMKEFMKRHYPKAEYIILRGHAEDEVINYLQKQKETLVVLGAYRRSRPSRWLKPSMADHLVQHLKLPLFIAHNKS
jgi:hypothetical protein